MSPRGDLYVPFTLEVDGILYAALWHDDIKNEWVHLRYCARGWVYCMNANYRDSTAIAARDESLTWRVRKLRTPPEVASTPAGSNR